MNEKTTLETAEGVWKTSMGAAFPGSRAVLRGQDLHADLNDLDWLALYVFGLTGKRYSPQQVQLLHGIWRLTSYPDARLWNNRIAALAGSARSTPALGLSAAMAASEAAIYGTGPCLSAYDFFVLASETGCALEAVISDTLAANRSIGGYGRPLVSGDERIEPVMELARQAGLEHGRYVRLAFQTEAVLLSGRLRWRMNYAALVAALLLELGFDRMAYHLFVTPIFFAGMPPCYLDAVQRPENLLFPLSCRTIRYTGQPERRWKPEK
jgi:citrate synthase